MTSSYSKTSVLVRPHVNEKPAFSKIFTVKRSFEKNAFSVTVFTGYLWTAGRIGEKISAFKQKRIRVDRALLPIAFLPFLLTSPSSLLKLPIY